MDTMTTPRLAAWQQRRALQVKVAQLQVYRGTLCGCVRCNDANLIEEMGTRIAQATKAISDLGDQMCEREPCSP